MENVIGEIRATEQGVTTTIKEGPKVVDMMNNLDTRSNKLRSLKIDPDTFKPIERDFTEGEGIKDLVDFLDTTIQVSHESGDLEVEETASLFKNNLRFIGDKELGEATRGIAQHLIDEAKKGKTVIVFPANLRSERYISLRALEEIDYLTEETPELRERIKMTQNFVEAAKKCKELLGNCLVAVPDDFVVSGSRIQGFATRIFTELIEQGFDPNKASEIIEANVVAIPQKRESLDLKVGRNTEAPQNLNLHSYYKIPEYRNHEGTQAVFTGISLTGSHSSTDYGFEMELKNFQRFLESKGIKRDLPLLHKIIRPYEMTDDNTSRYKDEELQKRWDRIQEKYGLQFNTHRE